MARLKVVKSASETKRLNFLHFVPKEENDGMTTAKDLTLPWLRSNRIVVDDSAFSSDAMAAKMKKNGLGFMMTATKAVPMERLKKQVLPSRGDNCSMTTTVYNANVLACVWYDRNHHSFVATAGSMALGNPHERTRWRFLNGSAKEVQQVRL